MHASVVSFRRDTRVTSSTLPWLPSVGSGSGWDSSSLQVLSRFRGLKRRAIAFSGRIPYFGGRFFTPRSRPMRVVTVIAVLLVGGAATLEAQHHFQFEIGGFWTFTRLDPALWRANQIGGGGRPRLLGPHSPGDQGGGRAPRPRP